MEVSKIGGSNPEDIQAKLEKKLGPEYISKRVGFGASRVAYIEGWKAINLANQIFGYNGWSTEVKNITIDFMDEKQGKFCIGCTAIIRVTLTDGTFREDIGYGTVENERRKSSAFERAKKSAVTDALKRSLRAFGNALGNCLYDKTFLAKIDKVKFDPPDFDEGNLYRAADEANEPARSHTIEQEGAGPPSKKRNVSGTRPNSSDAGAPVSGPQWQQVTARPPQAVQAARTAQVGQVGRELQQPVQSAQTHNSPQPEQDADELLDDSFMFSDELQDEEILAAGNETNTSGFDANPPVAVQAHAPAPAPPGGNAPVAFVTAKAAPKLQNQAIVPADGIFDPKFRAQSIRHTVDQTTSSHIKTAVLKEKGLPNHRSDIYNRFAPKGKLIADPDTSVETNATTANYHEIKNHQPQPQPQPQQNSPPTDQFLAGKSRTVQTGNSVRQLPPVVTTALPAQPQAPKIKPVGQPVGKPRFTPSNVQN
ncbi:LAME_0H11386g1_1 [Lachancea meyersii CBS 8951]|uniref:DNA repair and recombination protein RAD52 n=1 Tax=Lachancea meyersii CBS 8951 TaxID=1266667 RepID=A0A1G4KG46_9SACH|nr:LAME_0H11386g1_1 [Lachancea meyersii CBS 8951]